MNEILLYNAITQDSAANFISNLGWMGENQVYSVRMYCPGGDVQAGWGMWAKINELKAKGCHSIAKVDGSALSMGGFLLCSFDERLALSVSQLMIHRAVMPEYDENGEKIIYSASDKEFINRINADLKSRLVQIIDQEYNIKNVWREDEIVPREFSHELIVEQFPNSQDGFLKVKKIL